MARRLLQGRASESPFEDGSDFSHARYHAEQRRRRFAGSLKWLVLALAVGAVALFAWNRARLRGLEEGLDAARDAEAAAALARSEVGEPFYMLLAEVPYPAEEAGPAALPAKIELARVDPEKRKVVLVSIAPNTAFDMDDHGVQYLGSAYSAGGVPYLVDVVSRYAGVPISHYAAGSLDVFGASFQELLREGEDGQLATIAALPEAVSCDLSAAEMLALANELKGLDFTVDVARYRNPTASSTVAGVEWEVSAAQEWRQMMLAINAGREPDAAPSGEGGLQAPSASAPLDLSGSVLVLNGANVPGIAAMHARTLERVGYTASIGNTANPYATSFVIYDAPENELKAESVAKTLGGNFQVMLNDTEHTLEADVVVILGADRISSGT